MGRFMRNSLVLTVVASAVLAGCSGGGGNSATLSGGRHYTSPVLAGTIDPLVGTGTSNALTAIKAKDINADGVDEVVIGGRQSMNFTVATHENSALAIFGWNNDSTKLTNETNTWFQTGDNIIVGTEPSIKFGNFTGHTDGKLDMFVAGGTDSPDVLAPSVIYKNNGNNTFTRINLGGTNGWQHGSDVGDINGDGIDDMIAVGFSNNPITILGGATPTVLTGIGLRDGDSVTVGEFYGVGNGKYIIATNGQATPNFQKFDAVNNRWVDQAITVIDANPLSFATSRHTIRVQTLPVNNDGLQDFIMISRPGAGANQDWDSSTQTSYVEFFKNLGNGQFEKTGLFVKNGAVFYNIEVKDINGDGVSDIYLGATGDGSTVLLGKTNGADIVYTEAGTDMIEQFERTIGTAGMFEGGIGSVNIVKGPNGKSYLVGTSKTGGNQLERVYYSEITNTGVVTLEASVASLQQMWPQLSAADAENILSLTGTNFSDGVMLNLSQAINPIGQLLIPTRNGGYVPLTGSISGANFNGVGKMIATDSFNRDYGINMSGTITNPETMWAKSSLTPAEHTSASLSLASNVVNLGSTKLSNDSSGRVVGFANGIKLNDNTVMQVSISQVEQNPWFNMSGAWGKVNGATLSEVSGLYTKNNFTARGGVIRAVTQFESGLVIQVTPITALWADGEYAVSNQFTIGAGIFPKVLTGSVTAEIPTSVDITGALQYNSVEAKISKPTVGYLRANWNDKISKTVTYSVSGLIITTGNYKAQAELKLNF